MPSADPISDDTLAALKRIPTQTLIDALWVKGWPQSYIEGARPLRLGQKMAGRAVTLRFVPHRPTSPPTSRRGTSPPSTSP